MYFNTCAMLLVQQALCSCYDMLELPGATKRMLEAEPVMAFFETNGRRHPVPLKEDSLGAAALMLLWLADFACASMTQMYAVFHIQKNGVADMVEDTSRNPSILALFFHAEFRRALFRIMMILGRFNESFRRFAMLAKQQQDYPRLSYLASVMQVAKKGSFFHMDKYARFLTALDSQVVQSIENSGCTEQQKRQFEQQLIVEGTLCHIYRSILPGLRDLFGSTVNDIFSATTHLHSDSSPLTGMILRGQKVLQEYSTPSAIGIRSWAHVTGTHQEILKNKHFGREFANFCGGHS
ncbi:hypothetical protein BC832DRAFT_367603 [Gaertneriomyces semiglobifer]|nr:hypothetical protein BC832DRAFT_367603 [Gaertneriomyces semiglobifer]